MGGCRNFMKQMQFCQQWDCFLLNRLGHFITEPGRCNEACPSAGCGSAAAAGTSDGVYEATSIGVLPRLHSSQPVRPCWQRNLWHLKVGSPRTSAIWHPRLQSVKAAGHSTLVILAEKRSLDMFLANCCHRLFLRLWVRGTRFTAVLDGQNFDIWHSAVIPQFPVQGSSRTTWYSTCEHLTSLHLLGRCNAVIEK